MATRVSDVMTRNPVICSESTSITEAAQLMRDRDIGNVLVSGDEGVKGIVTDRDIVIRAVAEGGDRVAQATLGEVCTDKIAVVDADSSVSDAAELMANLAVRRLPVVQGDEAVGIVSLGDLAVSHDPDSALADISAAEPTE